jgi:hypothetical protein
VKDAFLVSLNMTASPDGLAPHQRGRTVGIVTEFESDDNGFFWLFFAKTNGWIRKIIFAILNRIAST